jgi:hypothetical protein
MNTIAEKRVDTFVVVRFFPTGERREALFFEGDGFSHNSDIPFLYSNAFLKNGRCNRSKCLTRPRKRGNATLRRNGGATFLLTEDPFSLPSYPEGESRETWFHDGIEVSWHPLEGGGQGTLPQGTSRVMSAKEYFDEYPLQQA